jgi:prevent-host-death family protein
MAVEEVPFTEARARLADLVGRVAYGGARVVLTRHGKPAAALVPVSDLERIEAMETADAGEFLQLHRGSFHRPSAAEPQPPGHLGIAAHHDGDPGRPPGP